MFVFALCVFSLWRFKSFCTGSCMISYFYQMHNLLLFTDPYERMTLKVSSHFYNLCLYTRYHTTACKIYLAVLKINSTKSLNEWLCVKAEEAPPLAAFYNEKKHFFQKSKKKEKKKTVLAVQKKDRPWLRFLFVKWWKGHASCHDSHNLIALIWEWMAKAEDAHNKDRKGVCIPQCTQDIFFCWVLLNIFPLAAHPSIYYSPRRIRFWGWYSVRPKILII